MKKHMRFIGILSAAIMSATLFAGCGSSAADSTASNAGLAEIADTADYYGEDSGYSGDYAYDGDYSYDAEVSDASVSVDEAASDSVDQKLIVTWNLSVQTEKYDDAMTELRKSVADAGGYIESEDETSYSDNERYNYLTIRIPSSNAEAWVNGISEYGTVVSRSKSTEDVTLSYVDMESRLDALRTEQETLMGMMETADNMSDILAIQSELVNVNANIESYESQLRVLDNQIDYTTIYVDINEVNREVATSQTFGQELKETFLSSMEGLGRFGRGFAIWLLGNSVILLIIGGLVVGLIFMIKGIKKHNRKKREKKNQSTEN